jgi:hypothetical protein
MPTRRAGNGWCDVDGLAHGHLRGVVADVVEDEVRRGRVERDREGRVRLARSAFEPDVVAALAELNIAAWHTG